MGSSSDQREILRECLASSFRKRSLLSSEPALCLGKFLFEPIHSDPVGDEILHRLSLPGSLWETALSLVNFGN